VALDVLGVLQHVLFDLRLRGERQIHRRLAARGSWRTPALAPSLIAVNPASRVSDMTPDIFPWRIIHAQLVISVYIEQILRGDIRYFRHFIFLNLSMNIRVKFR
jgi:hypothetical protein